MPSSGTPRGALGDQLVEAEPRMRAHRLGEGADAGQHDAVGARGRRRGRRVIAAVGADVLERLLDRAQVAHAVVDDGDPGSSLSVPLVDGHLGLLGSIATAPRSARAKALKLASITWWAFVPA